MQTRDQLRAQKVYEHILLLQKEDSGKKYGSLVLSAPTLIRTAGLLQAVAFYKAKNDPHHRKFLENLQTELFELKVLQKGTDLHEHLMKCDLTEYMRLTHEVLGLCQWHKRFAQSVLKVEPGGNKP